MYAIAMRDPVTFLEVHRPRFTGTWHGQRECSVGATHAPARRLYNRWVRGRGRTHDCGDEMRIVYGGLPRGDRRPHVVHLRLHRAKHGGRVELAIDVSIGSATDTRS